MAHGFARWALTMIVPRWERSAGGFDVRPSSSSVSCNGEKVKGRSVVAPVLTPATDPDRCDGFPRARFMPRPSM